MHDVFSATAAEARARGAQECLAPVVDLARDPRWGRTEETYGEDPYLVSELAWPQWKASKATGPFIDKSHVLATLKHFAVHGQPEGGTNVGPGNYSERVVREYFLKPFEAGVKEAHARSVMASYNEIDGIPSHSNRHLLTDILRQEWGFDGLLVSDYFAISDLRTLHHVAATDDEAAKMALDAGVDIELPGADTFRDLAEQVRQGRIAQATVDQAVARVLREKFLTGLFDDPYVDPEHAEKITNSPEHQQLALKAAHESIILLKNQNNLLPLDKAKYKHIAVIGPNAAELHLGGYSNNPGRGVSILQGIRDKVGIRLRGSLLAGLQDHRKRSGLERRQSRARRSRFERQANSGSREGRAQGRRCHPGNWRKRADFTRGLGSGASRRSRQPRSSRKSG